jgi:2'-hydroxyisoflavone reductase
MGLGLSTYPLNTPFVDRHRHTLRILILGGTGFIGPHMVRYALRRGHTLTLFNRGRTNTHLFPDVEKLVGDRSNDIESLRGYTWDAVIDNSSSDPRWTRDSAQLLRDAAGLYAFTSTRSVFSDFSAIGMNEAGPVYDVELPQTDDADGLGYGQRKVLCEKETERAFPGRALIVRPPLIVGPGDRTDRFTYWPARIHRGGEVLAPGDGSDPVGFIDVRDLAEFYIRLVELNTTGVFNAFGPGAPLSFAEMVYGIRAVTSTPVSFTWVETDFLLERQVRPYSHMPVWMPARGDRLGFNRFDLSKALTAGLTYRPLAVTARDTLEYQLGRPQEEQLNMRNGLPAERESELLREWHGVGR